MRRAKIIEDLLKPCTCKPKTEMDKLFEAVRILIETIDLLNQRIDLLERQPDFGVE